MIPTAHLLHGFIGSGKTTYARRLEAELPAVRFTLDEWMARLYGQSPPADRFGEYFRRIESLLWQQALSVLRAGSDVVMDLGFWSRESRDAARTRVLSVDAVPRFYLIDCPVEIMRERTIRRSEDPPPDSLWVDAAAFDTLIANYEPMQEREEFVVVDGTA